MSTNIPMEDWSSRFAHRLLELGTNAALVDLTLMGRELYPSHGGTEPEIFAQAEFDHWPPHDD